MDDDTFVCYECGEVCTEDEGNGETCDDCLAVVGEE